MATAAEIRVDSLNDYPNHRTENVRYRDTDRQGHVNNAVFSTYFECARTSLLYNPELKLISLGCEYVIVHMEMSFLKEMHWPGEVIIGTRVAKLGRSSVTMEQALFQNGACTATATSVMVMIGENSRKSVAFSPSAIAGFEKLAA